MIGLPTGDYSHQILTIIEKETARRHLELGGVPSTKRTSLREPNIFEDTSSRCDNLMASYFRKKILLKKRLAMSGTWSLYDMSYSFVQKIP